MDGPASKMKDIIWIKTVLDRVLRMEGKINWTFQDCKKMKEKLTNELDRAG